MEAKALAALPSAPVGDEPKTLCEPQPLTARHTDSWFYSVFLLPPQSELVTSTKEVAASNRIVYDGAARLFHLKPGVGAYFSGTLPLAAIVKAEAANDKYRSASELRDPQAVVTEADLQNLSAALETTTTNTTRAEEVVSTSTTTTTTTVATSEVVAAGYGTFEARPSILALWVSEAIEGIKWTGWGSARALGSGHISRNVGGDKRTSLTATVDP